MVDPHGPQGSRLARMLVREFYGDLCGAVFGAVLQRGQQRLVEVERTSGLALDKVKVALLVLIQQNAVDAYRVAPEAGPRTAPLAYFVYSANIGAVLRTMRKPCAVLCAEEDAADQGQSASGVSAHVVQGLAEHGRLRWDQLLHLVAGQLQRGEDELTSQFRECVRRLVGARLVERAPPCDLPPPAVRAHPGAQGRAKKAPQAGSPEEARMLADMAVTTAHTKYRSTRFDLPSREELAAEAVPGQKRKRGDGSDSGPVLWRLNFEEVTRRSRCSQCVDLVRDAHGEDAAQLVAAALRAGHGRAHDAAEGESPAVSAPEIAAATGGGHGLPAWDSKRVHAALRSLAEADPALICREETGAAPARFCVGMAHAVGVMQNQLIEKTVLDRHGLVGLRIFRLLTDKKQLEQKQIADLAVLPPKDAREALYSLFQDGFVALQDVPKLPDHAASRTFFTWFVNRAAVAASLVCDWLRAAGNIRARIDTVFQQHAQVLNLLVGPGAEAAGKQLTPAQRGAVVRYRRARLIGEGRFIALAPVLALFMD